MRNWTNRVLFALCVVGFVSLAHGLNYMYFTDREVQVFGDRIKFWHGDTLGGPVRSNDTIAIMQDPRFYDYVITTAADFWHGSGYQPVFTFPAIFTAPRLELPANAATFRQLAVQQGHYFNAGPSMRARVQIMGDSLRIWWSPVGVPFDSSAFTFYSLPDSAVVFFDCPLNLFGTVSTVLILGAGGRVGLEDNLVYTSADSRGVAPAGHSEKFVLISEEDIKILNTPANGRENSSGLGNSQTNRNLTDIVLDGIYVALHESFTFENQNDPDSGYVFDGSPDDRGSIYLYGSLIQARRGYVHRANRGSTGYLKQYRYDNTLRFWNFGLWNLRENVIEPQTLDFGDVPLGETVSDTIHLFNDYVPPWLDSISTNPPFFCPVAYDTLLFHHRLPVSFAASDTGLFEDSLRFHIPYYHRWMSVPLRGRSVRPSVSDSSFIPHPSSLSISSCPNPFNARTEIRFSLPQAGKVSLNLYDITGRKVATLFNHVATGGEHTVPLDATGLASGVYFVSIEAAGQIATRKILLLK
ncbi:MAG: T9SS type A sorting domain-containing protein [bacterium]|nr:T9SS type A sorting domain-containing protein [bacterium]